MRYHEITIAEGQTSSSGIIKPIKPLTPAQGLKRRQRQVRVQDQLRDEQRRHADKVTDLKTRASK